MFLVVRAVSMAIWASSWALGSGTTAQSANISMWSSPKGTLSGSSMMNAPLTTDTPGLVFSTWNAARNTWLVGLSAPATMASPSPFLIIRQPRYRGLAACLRASSMVIPFFLRSSANSSA